MTQDAAVVAPRSPLDRFLSIFADVKGGEGPRILALTLNIFLLLVCYYLLKVVREPLVLAGGTVFGLKGADLKNASAAGQAIVLLGVIPLYAILASRVDRIKLINICTAIFVVCLVAFFVFARAAVPIGFPFFIWVGVFNVFVIAQFWSFANDLYTAEAGKRVFAIVAFGQTFGAIIGSAVAGALVKAIGIPAMLPVAAAVLVLGIFISNLIDRHADKTGDHADAETPAAQPALADAAAKPHATSQRGGFSLVFASRYLVLIAFMVLVYNTVNTNGEWILGKIITAQVHETASNLSAAQMEAAEQQALGVFYAGYFEWTNILGALLQLFVVSRILKFAGVRWALLVMPTVSLSGYAIIVIAPLLWLVRGIKVAENSIDYSLENTTKQTLYLPTTRAEKYQAKAAIDTFFVRFGDVLSFGVVQFCTQLLNFDVKAVAVMNIGLVVIWWLLAQRIGRHHDRLVDPRGR